MIIKTGNIIILAMLLVTSGLFIGAKGNNWGLYNFSLLTAAQLLGLWGAVLLAVTFVLSSRVRLLEKLFGSLDQVTKTHQRVGVAAFCLLVGHPLLLALAQLPNYERALRYYWPGNDLAYNLGIGALQIMILILVFTLLIKLPYSTWIKTHDGMGLVVLLATGHVFLISSDVGRFMPLRGWMLSVLGMGIIFYIYKLIFYRLWGPKYKFLVEKIKEVGNVVEIYLRPKAEEMNYNPGQFGFVSFEENGFEESHPFSFSSAPSEKSVRLSVKMSGDYTNKIKQLKPGTGATVFGPYGRTYNDFFSNKEVVGIAGGIGITPFLSLLAAETEAPGERKIILFYSARNRKEAVYHQEIEQAEKKLNNLKYVPYFSDEKGRLTGQEVVKLGKGTTDKLFFLCGPSEMMEDMSQQLQNLGVPKFNIYYEDFNFKK